MSRIQIPKDLLENTFHGLTQAVEFVDETGAVLGYFKPAQVQYELENPIPSAAEIQRRLNQLGGRALKEILNDLERKAS